MTKKSFATWLIALSCLVSLAAFAAEPNPSGTVSISSKSVAVGIGVSWGDGTLSYGGRTYTFSLQGLSVVDLGISTLTSTGEVFSLKSVSDFSGNYAAGEAGIAIAGGQNDVIMKNEHGVVIRLHGTQQGVKFTLAPEGVAIKLKN
ncbi:MAG TPA: hypothetical protein VN326_12710 [Casimicrobiaceae bacterium]|jgi:hypothetical protein|nr:hypothetical protein [Casimicrobiaceae bacterium]